MGSQATADDQVKRNRHVAAAIARIEDKFGRGSIQRLGAMALEIVDALVRSTAFDIVAVDSVPALEPPGQKDTDASVSRGARQGRLLSEALRRLAAGVDRTRTVLLFGNRTTPAAEGDLTEQTSGGRALPFYAPFVSASSKANSYTRSVASLAPKWRRQQLRTK